MRRRQPGLDRQAEGATNRRNIAVEPLGKLGNMHDLMGRIAAVAGQFLRLQVQAGASAVQVFDSWAGALSLADYRTFSQPHSAAVLASVADLDVPRIHFGVGTGELLGAMGEAFDLSPAVEPRGAAPAELWRVAPGEGHPGGELGVIASVTHPFCGACDRTRLTSDGQIRSCLFSQEESDLRAILRGGGSDDDLAAAWAAAQWGKPRAHGIDDAGFVQPARTMSAIGG